MKAQFFVSIMSLFGYFGRRIERKVEKQEARETGKGQKGERVDEGKWGRVLRRGGGRGANEKEVQQ